MKILLVYSPMDLDHPTCSEPPLGIAYIAAALLEDGHEVIVKDFSAEKYNKADFIRLCDKFSPLMIGFSCTTSSYSNALKIMDDLQDWKGYNSVTFVLGGPHLSSLPDRTLRESNAHVIVRGEGEETVRELIKCLENQDGDLRKIKGISYKTKAAVYHNPDREPIDQLDSIPLPALHLLPMDKYRSEMDGRRIGSILSSRGCPFSCIYCYNSKNTNKKIRFRSLESVFDEMKILIEKYDSEIIYFVDDHLTFNRSRLNRFWDMLINDGSPIEWICQGRVDSITPELVNKMKKAGCIRITYGIETGDEDTLRFINKGTTLDQVRRAVRITKDAGIKIRGNFMIGFPNETHQSIRKTIQFARELKLDVVAFFIVTPYPHSKLWDIVIEQGIVDEKSISWDAFTQRTPVFATRSVSKEDLEYYLKLVNWYLFKENFKKKIFSLRKPSVLKRELNKANLRSFVKAIGLHSSLLSSKILHIKFLFLKFVEHAKKKDKIE